MVEVTFGCYVSLGKLASNDWEEDIELTDEEYERLVEAMKESILNTGDDFCDSESVRDIYDRVYEIVVASATESFLEFDYDVVKGYFKEGVEWRADHTYYVGVVYPQTIYEGLENELCGNEE